MYVETRESRFERVCICEVVVVGGQRSCPTPVVVVGDVAVQTVESPARSQNCWCDLCDVPANLVVAVAVLTYCSCRCAFTCP